MHGEVLLVRSAERRFSCRCRVGSWGWGGGLDWGFRFQALGLHLDLLGFRICGVLCFRV